MEVKSDYLLEAPVTLNTLTVNLTILTFLIQHTEILYY